MGKLWRTSFMMTEEMVMSAKDNSAFDITDFWIAFLNGPGKADNIDFNEMDENPKIFEDQQSTTFKG